MPFDDTDDDLFDKPRTTPRLTPRAPRNPDPDTALPLIAKYESGDRNIPNYRYDPTHTAQGHYQITNTNWRNKGPQAGVDLKQYPSAMAAPKEVQAKVAKLMYGERGFADWAPFNPRLRAAIGGGQGRQQSRRPSDDDLFDAPPKQVAPKQAKQVQDDDLFDQPSGQTLPPQSKLNRVNQPQTPATNPRSSRQPSVPTVSAPEPLAAGLTRRASSQPRQRQAPFIDKTIPNMVDMLTTPDTSPAGREREQVRQEVIADRAARRGTAASPTIKGLQRILSAPATSFAELARPEDENVSNETTERIEAMRAARRPEVQQLANDYRKQIRTSAAAANLGSGRGGQWTQELLAKATAGLSDYVAAGLRAVANPVLSPAGALLTDEDKAAKFADTVNTHALALQQAAEAEGADRNFASKLAQDAVAGAISSAPDMAAMMVGVPAPLAFGAGGATRALGRGQSPEQVANAAGTSALSAAPFEIPVGGTGLRGAIKRAGTVGAGTTALELAQGRTPSEALKGGLTNAIMSVGGGKKPEESSLNRGLDRIIEQEQARVSPSKEVNIPERPETIKAQLDAVQQGTRPAVLLTKGERRVPIPKGLTAVRTEAGTFYYDPKQISRETILQKVADGTHGEILGHVEPKSATTTEAVVARAPDGTEIQSSAVSPENVTKQAEVLQAQHPNAQIETGGEDLAKQVIAERVEAPQIPKEVLEARARKAQRGQNEAQLNPELQSGSGADIPRVAETPPETRAEPLVETTPRVEAESVVPTEVAKPTDGASTVTVRTNRGDVELDVSDTLAAADQIAAMKASIPEKEYHRIGKILTALNNPDRAAEFPEVAADVQRVQSVPKQAAAPKLENDVFTFPTASPRRTITVFKNPTGSDLREIRDRFLEEYPNAPKGEPKYRTTRDAKGNEYVWMSGEGQHGDVEPLIRNKWGEEVNKNMEPRVESPDLVTKPTEVTTEAQQAPTETPDSWNQTDKELDARFPLASDTVDGRTVGTKVANQDSIGASVNDPVTLKGIREVPSAEKLALLRSLEKTTTPEPTVPKVITDARARKAKRAADKAEGIEYRRAGADPYEIIDDLLDHGWEVYSKAKPKFDEWAKEMRDKFGEVVEPHLKKVYATLTGASKEESATATPRAEREPSTTAVKNASMEADRVAMDLPELAQAEPRKAPEVHRRAIEANTKDPRSVDRLTEQALEGDKNFTDVETAQVRLRAQEIKNRESELLKEIDATDDPAEIRGKRAELDSLTDEFDQLSQATKKAGTEWGRAGVARQQAIDQDFSLVAMKARLKAAKGEKLSEKQNAAVEGLHKRISALEADLEKANEKVSQKTLQRQIDRVVRQSRRGETRATLDDEFAALKTQFAKARAEVKGVQASGFAGLDPEGKLTKIVAKMAENRVKTGINEAGKLVDSIYDAISEHVDIDKRELRDLISGYGLTKELSQVQVKKSLRDMKSVMRLASALEDAEAKQKPLRSGLQRDVDTPEVKELRKQLNDKLREVGLTGPLPGPTLREGVGRTEGPRQSEARKLPMEGPRLSDARQVPLQGPRMSEARSSGIPLQGPKLSDVNKLPAEGPRLSEGMGRTQGPRIEEAPFVGPRQSDVRRLPAEGPKITDAPKVGPKETLDSIRTRYAKQIAEYERRIKEGDFSDRPAPRKVIDTPETAKMREDLLRTKNQYQRLLNQQRGGHQLRNISGIYKAWLLSGPLTHVKNIAGTGMYQVFDEGARVPAVIMDAMMSKVTGQRGIEGNSPSAILAAVKQSLTVGAKEAKEIMKHGATREDLERHQYQEIDFGVNTGKRAIDQGVKAIELAHNVIFRFMSASDRVWYQGAYKRNLVDRARVQARNEGLKGEARVRRAQELIDNPSDQLAADAKHDALVSTFNNDNVLSTKIKGARGMASETKFAKGLTKKGRERLNAAENLALDFVLPFDRTPTNVVSRIVEGSPLGYLKNAGQLVKAAINRGMSAEDQRQFSQTFGRATAGTALIALGWKLADSVFDVDDKGNVVLKLGSHRIRLDYVSPVANLVAVGVKLRRNHDKEKGLGEDAKVIGRELTNIPLLRATNQITELGQDPARSAAKTGARYAFSAVPFNSAIRTAAQAIDPKERKAKGFVQEIQKNIPILRERLPEDVNRRAQVVEPMVDKFRKGRLGEDELQTAVDKGTITEAEAKRIKHEGSMSVQEADFSKRKPQDALDTFQRLSPSQRERVREIMERKAWSLLYSDSMEGNATEKERKRAKLQQQFDRLGLTPKASSTNRGGLRGAVQSAFA